MAVALEGFLAASLIQSAIEKELLAARFDVVHGSGDGPGGAPKGEFHISRIYNLYDADTARVPCFALRLLPAFAQKKPITLERCSRGR